MTKPIGVRTHEAVCEAWTNPNGWKLRVTVEEESLSVATVVRSADEMLTMMETWRLAFLQTGWI